MILTKSYKVYARTTRPQEQQFVILIKFNRLVAIEVSLVNSKGFEEVDVIAAF